MWTLFHPLKALSSTSYGSLCRWFFPSLLRSKGRRSPIAPSAAFFLFLPCCPSCCSLSTSGFYHQPSQLGSSPPTGGSKTLSLKVHSMFCFSIPQFYLSISLFSSCLACSQQVLEAYWELIQPPHLSKPC